MLGQRLNTGSGSLFEKIRSRNVGLILNPVPWS